MGNLQSFSLLSYGFLEEFDTKTLKELYPSFAYDMYAQSYLNEVDDPINPDDIDEDLLLDDIVSIISRDAVMRSILAYANIPRPTKKVKIPRDVCPQKTSRELWNFIWGKRNLSVRQEIAEIGVYHSTREQSEFRLDFPVPFSLFEDIVKDCKEAHIFTTGKKAPTISDEFKVLACLRILGRNYVTASVRELLGAAKTIINSLFKLFLVNYSKVFYKKYVYIGLNEVEKVYRYMGLPGCIGSMDVTHVQWGACPSNLLHHCIGRYGYPTLGFNFICSHNRRIQYVSRAFYGATNDITITYNDNYPRGLMLCQVHTDRIFRTFNRQGDVTFWRGGGYVTTDGGYQTCFGFMNPIVPSYYYHFVVWGEWVESVRKDVERLFGALKNRFVRLKSNIILYHKVSTITAAVRVCSILHNRLLEYDNMIEFDWKNIDPNTPDEELYERYANSTIPFPEPSLVDDPYYQYPLRLFRLLL